MLHGGRSQQTRGECVSYIQQPSVNLKNNARCCSGKKSTRWTDGSPLVERRPNGLIYKHSFSFSLAASYTHVTCECLLPHNLRVIFALACEAFHLPLPGVDICPDHLSSALFVLLFFSFFFSPSFFYFSGCLCLVERTILARVLTSRPSSSSIWLFFLLAKREKTPSVSPWPSASSCTSLL